MRETLSRLIDLQRADEEVTALERRLEDLDGLLTGARAAHDAAKSGLDKAHHALQEAQAATHRKEMDLDQREGQIKQHEVQLNTATSNKEYSGILLKIGTLKAENGKIEEEILRAMDVVEARERDEEAARAKVREAEAGLRAAEARRDEQRNALEAELAASRGRREEIAASIPAEATRVYERIRAGNRRSGTAVVAVHGEYCQGCQMRITPQELTELIQAQRILLCRTCQRILVLES